MAKRYKKKAKKIPGAIGVRHVSFYCALAQPYPRRLANCRFECLPTGGPRDRHPTKKKSGPKNRSEYNMHFSEWQSNPASPYTQHQHDSYG